tara:strand:- start:367719 stop:368348 length:630 start_codon:yes stop_codon:yes gene_type:complete
MVRVFLFAVAFATVVTQLDVGLAAAQETDEASACDSRAAKLLRADAKRATQWNWGWGATYLGAAIGQSGVAMWTDDEDLKVSLFTGAAKASLGVLNQIIFPKRIYAPNTDCSDLAERIAEAREVERKGHNWLAHGTVIAANVAGFAIVAGITENYVLATSGTIVGSLVGEFAIYTSPNRLRAAGLGVEDLKLVPQVSSKYSGLLLQGSF